jgi:dipeptidyl aminopeptidase/acylaminoacyl peptidase
MNPTLKLLTALLLATPLLAADSPAPAVIDGPAVRQLLAPGGGVAVTCTIYAPKPVPTGKAGLVVHLYGANGSHKKYNVGRAPYDEFRGLLAARGYWLVVPELGPLHWMNDAACGQVDAVIAAMIHHERIDPARVHLLGTSMGGGNSLIYLMRRPGKIKSAVAIFPMTDLAQWLLEQPGYRKGIEQAHDITPDQRDDSLRKISPLHHPEAFRTTPVFLLHGDRDVVVPPHHSRDFAAALKEQGCEVIYREAAGANHTDTIALTYQQELANFITDGKLTGNGISPSLKPLGASPDGQ